MRQWLAAADTGSRTQVRSDGHVENQRFGRAILLGRLYAARRVEVDTRFGKKRNSKYNSQ
jgi:hypothetical protein